jgi:hypothetical protein
MQSPTLLFALLFVSFIVFMVYSAILMYHWFKYAMNTPVALLTSIVYMGIGFVLFFIMATSASSLL